MNTGEKTSVVDLFNLSSDSFTVKEKDQEVVTSGSGAASVDDIDAEEKQENTEEPEVGETKKVETTIEQEEVPVVGSDEELIQDLINNDLLVFDEEKEYSMDKEGLKELILDTREKSKELGKKEYIETLSKNPEAKTLLEVLEKGGTVNDYFDMISDVDFSTIELYNKDNEPNIRFMLNIVEDHLKLNEIDDEDIEEELAELRENPKLLEKRALNAQKALVKHQAKEKESKLKELELKSTREKEVADLEAEKFKAKVVNLSQIKDFKIDKKEAEKLYDFITKKDKSGKTEFAKKDNDETRLLYAYLAMNDFKKSKLTDDIKNEVVKTLKKKVTNYQDSNVSSKRSSGDATRSTESPLKGVQWIV